MHPRLLAALLFLTLPAWAGAAVSLVHVWPTHRTADSFRRITEYIGGSENTGREIVLRTKAEAREGYYFLSRIKADGPEAGAVLVLELVLPGSPAIHTYRFPIELSAGHKVFQVGVTGADWPDAQTRPAAWRVTVHSANDTVLADSPSFLWMVPPTQ